jgi:hypothetical protein
LAGEEGELALVKMPCPLIRIWFTSGTMPPAQRSSQCFVYTGDSIRIMLNDRDIFFGGFCFLFKGNRNRMI